MTAARTRIGHLRQRIEIQQPVPSRSASGQELLAWKTWAITSANVRGANTGSDEQVEGDQLVATTRVLFTIRFRKGLDKKMRILYRDSLYNIVIIHDDGRDTYITITAVKQE